MKESSETNQAAWRFPQPGLSLEGGCGLLAKFSFLMRSLSYDVDGLRL